MFRYSLVILTGLWVCGTARPATWADAMFEELSKDFGSVPRGPLLAHSFRVTNQTGSHVHIGSVRVSCGCVSAQALQTDLAPGQSTHIQVTMDSRRFTGSKAVTIYVQLTRPGFEEVRLWVQANSRDDLTVTPDTLALGRVQRGSSPKAQVTVTLSGDGQAHVREVSCESNYVLPRINEVRRDANEVVYALTARLRSDAPVGRWFTDVWLATDNASIPKVRVPLTVEIASALSVSPPAVQLGQVKVGTEAERKVIVRGVKPFSITAVKGADSQLQVKPASPNSRPVHVLSVTLRPTQAGEQKWNLRILTDLPGESSIDLQAQAEVVPVTH